MHRYFLVGVLASLTLSSAARAGDDARPFEVTPILGAWIPLGSARNDFKTAPLAGVQITTDIHPNVALVGTFAWTGTDAKSLASTGLDLLQYDLGARIQQPFHLGGGAILRPHFGVGYGLCTIRFDDSKHPGGTDVGMYTSTGVDVAYGALAAGLTARWDFFRTNSAVLDSTYSAVEVFASAGLRF